MVQRDRGEEGAQRLLIEGFAALAWRRQTWSRSKKTTLAKLLLAASIRAGTARLRSLDYSDYTSGTLAGGVIARARPRRSYQTTGGRLKGGLILFKIDRLKRSIQIMRL